LMSWYYSSKNLSLGALDCLVYNVISAPDFQHEDLEGFSAIQENRHLDNEASDHLPENSESLPWLSSDVLRKPSVFLPLPFTHKSYKSEKHAPTIQIHVDIIKSGAMDFAAKWFHWHGFQLYWKPSENEPKQCVYGKVYTSDEFLELEKTITPVEGCNLEQVVLPLMFYLDSTYLANFGAASLWPVYMWFGNLSKYIHGKVGSFSAHHLAYLPSVSYHINYFAVYGTVPTPDMLTHLRQELIQAVWKHLLSEEFKQMYREGIVVKCGDGVWQRLYPHFYCYSANYKELVLLAGTKQMGRCLCATCWILRSQILHVGSKLYDMIWSQNWQTDSQKHTSDILKARKLIFIHGIAATGNKIHQILGESFVPVKNFQYKLNEHLLICLLPSNTEITDQNCGKLIIRDNMIYEHKTLCVNYTTYDQDTLNPWQQSDVMALADNNVHPYWFRIVRIFHAIVQLNESGHEFQQIEFLWGCWYGFNNDAKSGFAAKHCYQIGFVEGQEAFGFVNPADVLCAVHLIPQFAGSCTNTLLGPSVACCMDEENLDYEWYYVEMFVDRDTFVQFTGGGIGHRTT
ncbi:hypothetical protein J132_10503, partial [Termitomyces sp. J132]